jgi:hypothetical protein
LLAAAWEFWNKNKTKVTWDLVVLNPPFVCTVTSLPEIVIYHSFFFLLGVRGE